MVPWLMILASAMQKKQADAQEQKARQGAVADSYARGAARYGYPTDQIEAARFNKQFTDADEEAKSQWVSSMLGAIAGGGFGGKGMGQPYGGGSMPDLSRAAQARAGDYADDGYLALLQRKGMR